MGKGGTSLFGLSWEIQLVHITSIFKKKNKTKKTLPALAPVFAQGDKITLKLNTLQ